MERRIVFVALCLLATAECFVPYLKIPSLSTAVKNNQSVRLSSSQESEDAEKYRDQAEKLREQIRQMEEKIGDRRLNRNNDYGMDAMKQQLDDSFGDGGEMSLKNRNVLVVGANGRLGSMVCRYLLRNHPQTKVVAAVHYVNEESRTARGWGRLSYEIGAEDGIGSIGPAWDAQDRTATFQYSDEMKDYNLQNIRVVEVELLDPVQCNTITEDIDSVIWCATDFNGNRPRAISGLNVAFLFRAVADPTKGRVEIEGLRNILGGLKRNKQQQRDRGIVREVFLDSAIGNAIDVCLVSTAPKAFRDVETPFGTFNGLKREGEDILRNEFPSLSYTVLQMCRYEDNFVEESLDLVYEDPRADDDDEDKAVVDKRRINRRDAARAASEALIKPDIKGKTVQVWTAER